MLLGRFRNKLKTKLALIIDSKNSEFIFDSIHMTAQLEEGTVITSFHVEVVIKEVDAVEEKRMEYSLNKHPCSLLPNF